MLKNKVQKSFIFYSFQDTSSRFQHKSKYNLSAKVAVLHRGDSPLTAHV